jgi:prefoldin subunit 2
MSSECVLFWIRRTVIDAISKLDHSRKCFRLIGGVLVERTIAEVLPAVQKNSEGVRISQNGFHMYH